MFLIVLFKLFSFIIIYILMHYSLLLYKFMYIFFFNLVLNIYFIFSFVGVSFYLVFKLQHVKNMFEYLFNIIV